MLIKIKLDDILNKTFNRFTPIKETLQIGKKFDVVESNFSIIAINKM